MAKMFGGEEGEGRGLLLPILIGAGLPFLGAFCFAGIEHMRVYGKWKKLYGWAGVFAFFAFGLPQMSYVYFQSGAHLDYLGVTSKQASSKVPSVEVGEDYLASMRFRFGWPGFDLRAEHRSPEYGYAAVDNGVCTHWTAWQAGPSGGPELTLESLEIEVKSRLTKLGVAAGDIKLSQRRRDGRPMLRGDAFAIERSTRISAWQCGEPGLYFSLLTAAETMETMVECHETALQNVECYWDYQD